MQRLDITLRRNDWPKLAVVFLFILFCASFVVAQQAQPAPSTQQPAAGPAQTAQQPQNSGALPNGIHREGTDNILVDASGIPLEDQSGKTLPPSNATEASIPSTPPPNVNSSTTTVQAPTEAPKKSGDRYVFHAVSQEVVLHATVVDQHSRLVTNLNKSDFTVYEDGQPQVITNFSKEDVPVSLGILVDNSGSMRDKRQAVNTAALDLVKASNRDDEVFVVNFSDEAIIDTDLTSDISKMQEGLQQIDSRGGTALYDAVVASADYLAKKGRREKKVLLVVTDGEDNASTDTLEQAVRRVQDDNGPMIYTIGILGGEHEKRAKRALESLAINTGGVAFFPKDLGEVDQIARAVARDIRSQYSIYYRPTRPQEQGGFRQVKVDAHAPGYGRLQVRTRAGYYANPQQRASK
ncbi:MAG TPA: VWA domain-containing protein [Terriglobales bacterium]|nr:VWA domain-containing protein [Terriglobales bacterium]